ncbi:MAG: NUDIX hydrolase [Planctomycetota bacterium]
MTDPSPFENADRYDVVTDATPAGDHARGEIELVTDPHAAAGFAQAQRQAGKSDRLGVVYEDPYILLVRDLVRFPNGSLGTYLRLIERSSLGGAIGAAVFAVHDGRLLLLKQYRHATRSWELELPRGRRDAGDEADLETARREFAEEVGWPIARLKPLGTMVPNSGILAGHAALFYAELADGPPANTEHAEATEALGGTRFLDADQVAHALREGTLRDSFTLAALALAQARGLWPASTT